MATTIDVRPTTARNVRPAGFVGPATGRVSGRRPSRGLIWAAVVVALACSGLVVLDRIAADAPARPSGPPTGTIAATVPVADFTPRADDVCVAFARATATIGFRPASHASDVADAQSRMAALDQAIAVLATMASPVDDPNLVRRVVHDLGGARATAGAVVAAPSAAVAGARSELVDPAIAGAFAPLASHGATRCRF
jgi:hypothetical protein